LQEIWEAASFQELADIRNRLLDASALSPRNRAAELASLVVYVNLIHDRILQQSVHLAVRKLEGMGLGTPPVPFAFLLFGSGGRQEQALVSDQDNGLIYQLTADASKDEQVEVENYFHLLGAAIVQGMEEVGYPPCHGHVTCIHRRWRGSVEEWKTKYEEWATNPVWENARYLLLAGDARVLYGHHSVYEPVEQLYHRLLTDHTELLSRLVSNILHYRVPLGWFGRIYREVHGRYRGAINLKNGIYLPYVNAIRHHALANGIQATTTLERISALRRRGDWSSGWTDEIDHYFRQLLGLRLVAPLHWKESDYNSNSYLMLSDLPAETIGMIRTAMKHALKLQRMTAQLPQQAQGRRLR